jgi:hypothetical protein
MYIPPLLLAGMAVGVVLGLILRYFIFRASCALIDVEPSHFRSILIVMFALAITLALGVPIFGMPLGLLDKPLFNVQESVSLYIVWCLSGLALIWAILALLYIPAVPVSFKKGFLLSGFETVLGILANALILAIVLVIWAAVQIATSRGPNPAHSAAPASPSSPSLPPALTTTHLL